MKKYASAWLCATAILLAWPDSAAACKRRARCAPAPVCLPVCPPVCPSVGAVGPRMITVQVMVSQPLPYRAWPAPQTAYGTTDEGLAMSGKVWSPTNPAYGPYYATGPAPTSGGGWYIYFGTLPSQSGVTLSLSNAN